MNKKYNRYSGTLSLTDDRYTLNEAVDSEAAGLLASSIFAALLIGGILILNKIQTEKYYKEAAKSAVVVTREEIKKQDKFLKELPDRIEKAIKSSKYKKFLDNRVFKIYNGTTKSEDKEYMAPGDLLHFRLFAIDFTELAKMKNIYDDVIISNESYISYVKKEVKDLSDLCKKIRDIAYTDPFIKEHYTVQFLKDGSERFYTCFLVAKHSFIFEDSKYNKK